MSLDLAQVGVAFSATGDQAVAQAFTNVGAAGDKAAVSTGRYASVVDDAAARTAAFTAQQEKWLAASRAVVVLVASS